MLGRYLGYIAQILPDPAGTSPLHLGVMHLRLWKGGNRRFPIDHGIRDVQGRTTPGLALNGA